MVFSLSFYILKTQTNLVPNWSFEDYTDCPNSTGAECDNLTRLVYKLKDWRCIYNKDSSPDYINNCSSNWGLNNLYGFQDAKTGDGYIAARFGHFFFPDTFFLNESFQCTLKDTLKFNKTYCVEFYVSLTDKAYLAKSNFGAFFSFNHFFLNSYYNPNLGVFSSFFFDSIPQVENPLGQFLSDKINWTKINGSFVAKGGESNLTLGFFGQNSIYDTLTVSQDVFLANFSTYYIDDVSVEEVINAQAGEDKVINCGDTVVIGADSAIGATYQWFPSAGLVNDKVAFAQAHPTITTTYVLQKTQCKVITYDTVIVTVNGKCPIINQDIDDLVIPNVFTPNQDGVNDVWQFNLGIGNTLKSLHIYNRWGNLVAEILEATKLTGVRWDGYTTAGEPCSEGVYYFTLEVNTPDKGIVKLNGYVSLMR
jgi:gliding motility-associated-like protein